MAFVSCGSLTVAVESSAVCAATDTGTAPVPLNCTRTHESTCVSGLVFSFDVSPAGRLSVCGVASALPCASEVGEGGLRSNKYQSNPGISIPGGLHRRQGEHCIAGFPMRTRVQRSGWQRTAADSSRDQTGVRPRLPRYCAPLPCAASLFGALRRMSPRIKKQGKQLKSFKGKPTRNTARRKVVVASMMDGGRRTTKGIALGTRSSATESNSTCAIAKGATPFSQVVKLTHSLLIWISRRAPAASSRPGESKGDSCLPRPLPSRLSAAAGARCSRRWKITDRWETRTLPGSGHAAVTEAKKSIELHQQSRGP